MNEQDLIKILKKEYTSAKRNEKVVSINLFGIKYAADLNQQNCNLKTIAEEATSHHYYNSEISRGIKLANYVKINEKNTTKT